MVEAGVNLKVIQDTLGHSDISTTLNIYADVTKEARMESAKQLEAFYKKNASSQKFWRHDAKFDANQNTSYADLRRIMPLLYSNIALYDYI